MKDSSDSLYVLANAGKLEAGKQSGWSENYAHKCCLIFHSITDPVVTETPGIPTCPTDEQTAEIEMFLLIYSRLKFRERLVIKFSFSIRLL